MKLKPAIATEVFINEPGYVAIKQPGPYDDQDMNVVQFTPEQLPIVVRELTRLRNIWPTWWEPVVREAAEPVVQPSATDAATQCPAEFERFLQTASDETLARFHLCRTRGADRGE